MCPGNQLVSMVFIWRLHQILSVVRGAAIRPLSHVCSHGHQSLSILPAAAQHDQDGIQLGKGVQVPEVEQPACRDCKVELGVRSALCGGLFVSQISRDSLDVTCTLFFWSRFILAWFVVRVLLNSDFFLHYKQIKVCEYLQIIKYLFIPKNLLNMSNLKTKQNFLSIT